MLVSGYPIWYSIHMNNRLNMVIITDDNKYILATYQFKWSNYDRFIQDDLFDFQNENTFLDTDFLLEGNFNKEGKLFIAREIYYD